VRPIVGAAAAVLVLAGCGSSASRIEATTPTEANKLMVGYLHSKHLSYRWVACLRSGRSFKGAAIVRCNVNFGDPHIEIYCAVVVGGRVRAAEWRQPVRGRQDRAAFQKECARRL
jgi:hypothetical protein